MILHPDIARWVVAVEQERLAGLARRLPSPSSRCSVGRTVSGRRAGAVRWLRHRHHAGEA